jgi:hypothetical protein
LLLDEVECLKRLVANVVRQHLTCPFGPLCDLSSTSLRTTPTSRPTDCNIRHCVQNIRVEDGEKTAIRSFRPPSSNTSLHLHHQSSGLPARSSCFRFLHIFNAGFSSHIMLSAPGKPWNETTLLSRENLRKSLHVATKNTVLCVASPSARVATTYHSSQSRKSPSTYVGAMTAVYKVSTTAFVVD